jgi:hypothetical protein
MLEALVGGDVDPAMRQLLRIGRVVVDLARQ